MALTQIIPIVVARRSFLERGQQGLKPDLGTERDIDFDSRQACGLGIGHGRRFGCRTLCTAVPRSGRLDPRLARRRIFLRYGSGTLWAGRPAPFEDAVKFVVKPCPPRFAAGEIEERKIRVVELVRFEDRPRQRKPVLLRERQGAQQVIGVDQHKALGEALEKLQRPLVISIEEGCDGCKQQNVSIARLCPDSLFGDRQKYRRAILVGNRRVEQFGGGGVSLCRNSSRRRDRLSDFHRQRIERQFLLRR